MWKKLTKLFRHNSGLCIGLLICAGVLVWVFGCESSTKSPVNPDETVTLSELDVLVENLANEVALAYKNIAKQDEVKATFLNIGLTYVTGEGVNPVGIVTTLIALAGLGAAVDNRRKDAIIKTNGKTNVNKGKKKKVKV